jgi:hypothetical protein
VHFHGSTLSGDAKHGSEQHDQYSTHHIRSLLTGVSDHELFSMSAKPCWRQLMITSGLAVAQARQAESFPSRRFLILNGELWFKTRQNSAESGIVMRDDLCVHLADHASSPELGYSCAPASVENS